MYDEYAFSPNYPAKLEGDPPMDKVNSQYTFFPLYNDTILADYL